MSGRGQLPSFPSGADVIMSALRRTLGGSERVGRVG